MENKVKDLATYYKKATCAICGHEAHVLVKHIEEEHGMIVEMYQSNYPAHSVYSQAALDKIQESTEQAGNKMVDFDVKQTFGCVPFEKVSTVKGFENPQSPYVPRKIENYHFNPENLGVCLYALSKPLEPALFIGPTGSGKTSCIEQVASRLNRTCYKISFDGDLTRSDVIGQWILQGKDNMAFNYGLLPRAMKEGAILVLDEFDCINPSVAMLFQSVLEGGTLTIPETAEVITRHENFRIFGTANTNGQGDESGLYNGTTPQNFATVERWKTTTIVDYPSASIEKNIISKTTGIKDKETLQKFVEVAKLIREAFIKQEIRVTMSTRTLINIGEKFLDFGELKLAYHLAFLNRLNSEDKVFCLEIIQRVWSI